MISSPGSVRPKRRRTHFTDIVVSIVLPWLVFFLVISLFLFAYHDMQGIVWIFITLCFGLALLFLILGSAARHGTFLAIGFLCLTSVIVGTVVGLWLYNEFLKRYWQLDSGMEYKNVDPMADAKKTSDAGVIHFEDNVFVDDKRTIGFVTNGGIFCVAPVVAPPNYMSSVQYWAVGEDCCEKRSNFDCGTSRDANATTAITEQRNKPYSQAIAEAESVYGLNSTEGAQVVSFVADPKEAIGDIWDETLTIALVAMIMDLCICAVAGLVLAKILIPAQQPLLRK